MNIHVHIMECNMSVCHRWLDGVRRKGWSSGMCGTRGAPTGERRDTLGSSCTRWMWHDRGKLDKYCIF